MATKALSKRWAIGFGLGAIAASLLGWGDIRASAHPADVPRTVLVIVAHPDDEIFIAPAIAAEARSGSRVRIVYATDGDAGPGVSDFEKGEELAAARRKEAYCSAQALGAIPVYLKFPDGRLADKASDKGSEAMQLREKLDEEITLRRPEVIMTWGPDGGYGHSDHRMVSNLVTEIVQSIDSEWRPTLLYPGIIKGRVGAAEIGLGWAETDPSLLDMPYTYNADDLAKANAAAQCHVTQFDEAMRANLVPLLDRTAWQGEVHFRSAF